MRLSIPHTNNYMVSSNDYMISNINYMVSNKDYLVSSNYFYVLKVICLHTVIWFQLTNNNPKLTIIISSNYS